MVGEPEFSRVRLLIYAAVPDERMLQQGFYAAEADGLREHPDVGAVRLTSRLGDVFRGDYDGLVSFFYSYSAIAAFLARVRGRPVVVTGGGEQVFRELAGSRFQYFARLIGFQLTLLFANQILATSTSDLARMRAVAWFGRGKLSLSYHGAPALERKIRLPDPIARRPAGSFVTICGLDTPLNVVRKGVPEAVRLLARASLESPDAKLTIIGRATCRAMVEEQARALGVEDRLVFAGYVDEATKSDLLRSHRYYLQMSIYEGFGIGAIEALAQGCQIIHSGVGGLRDTVADFGVVIARDAVEQFTLKNLPEYTGLEDERLARHLAAFTPMKRADSIVTALFGANSALSQRHSCLPQ